jgi:hypothetical protein
MKIENEVQITEPGADSIIPTMRAGKAHVKWMVSSYRPESRGKSWRIVMHFDEIGDLTSYWEAAFDEHGNELHGGDIEREAKLK